MRSMLLLVAPLAMASCRRPVTGEECAAMLDRYVDMTISADPMLAQLPPAQADAAREMKKALKKGEKSYAKVQARCEREVSRREHDCAMDAKTPNDWEACIE